MNYSNCGHEVSPGDGCCTYCGGTDPSPFLRVWCTWVIYQRAGPRARLALAPACTPMQLPEMKEQLV